MFYRYAQKYRINDTDYRTLTKVYGLRFVVTISGRGGQFNIVNLFVAIGIFNFILIFILIEIFFFKVLVLVLWLSLVLYAILYLCIFINFENYFATENIVYVKSRTNDHLQMEI
jgi:hypothetical protein